MKQSQRIVLLLYFVLIVILCIFVVPYQTINPGAGTSWDAGYSTIFSPPSAVNFGKVNYSKMLTELFAATVAAAAIFIFLGWRRRVPRGEVINVVSKMNVGSAITWATASMLIASLFLFPPSRVYDAEATRITAIQNLRVWERLHEILPEQRLPRLDYESAVRLAMIDIEDSLKADSLGMTMAKYDSVFNESIRKRVTDIFDDPEGISKFSLSSQDVFKNSHYPIWLSDRGDIRYHQLALEVGVILLVAIATSMLFKAKKRRAQVFSSQVSESDKSDIDC